MSRLATSFVLGYHGCDASIAHKAVLGDIELLKSEKDYDWLGPGIYFWESDSQRAMEWAQWRVSKGDFTKAAVLGAAIDLRDCLDLVSREDLALVRAAYDSFVRLQKVSGLPLPENQSIKGDPNSNRVLRFLDCAVIRHLHRTFEEAQENGEPIAPFDTVRGMFVEGKRLYKGSGFRQRSHVQIAVRSTQCIRGLFHERV